MITPVLLAGDDGLSLRPVSRTFHPADNRPCDDGASPFLQAVGMLRDAGCTEPIVVTAPATRDIVVSQLHQNGMADADVLVTPHPRGSASAVMAAALRLGPAAQDLLFICSAMQLPTGPDPMARAVAQARAAAESGAIVTFGLPSGERAFDFGCLKVAPPVTGEHAVPVLQRYTAPPGRTENAMLLDRAEHLGHTQTYLLRIDRLFDALAARAPGLSTHCIQALKRSSPAKGATLLDAESFAAAGIESLENALLTPERTILVVPLDAGDPPAPTGPNRTPDTAPDRSSASPEKSADQLVWHGARDNACKQAEADWQRFLH